MFFNSYLPFNKSAFGEKKFGITKIESENSFCRESLEVRSKSPSIKLVLFGTVTIIVESSIIVVFTTI